MSSASKRVQTLRTLIDASAILPAERAALHREIERVANVQRVQDARRRSLLAVLHMTRALDTSARCLLVAKSIPIPHPPALGAYLTRFVNHAVAGVGHLPENKRARYQKLIVDQRNRFMHGADTFPSTNEERKLLAEMQACLAVLVSL